jgi:hypothetical protein
MSPKKIVQKSLEKHLDLIAICDHNTAENAAATLREGTRQGIGVLPGMEICSREEVHLVALFNNIEDTLKMQEYVYAHLPGKNQPEVFGHQVVADEHDQVLGENPRLLIGATQLSLLDIVEKAHHLGGICISAHVDRPSYSLIGQLGFIPEDLLFGCTFFTRHWKGVDGICFSCAQPGRNPIGPGRCKWAQDSKQYMMTQNFV